ncbi:MAG: IS4 family transposase [Thermoanaerobaculia bacterium]
MDQRASLEHEWPYLLSFLPEERELEETAREWGAIQRVRAVDKASTLLRLALVYGFCGYSLRQTVAWAEAAEVASLSDVALLKRLRKAPDWLGHLLGSKLAERVGPLATPQGRLRLIDATTLSAPGSSGVDWRIHLDFDLGAMTISEVQVTQVEGGESLLRYEFDPGELVVADRGYAHRIGLAHVVDAGAHFLVRLNWATVPLQWRAGEPFDLLSEVRQLTDARPAEFSLEIQPSARDAVPAIPVRLLAVRKSQQATQEAQHKVLAEASRKGKKVLPQTLELAGYVLVLTSTTARDLSAEQALETYRFRWQIELVFKRLKSLLHLDHLPAKDPDLARTFLYSKLLAAILLEQLTGDYLAFSPWGFRIRSHTPTVPLAYPASAPL